MRIFHMGPLVFAFYNSVLQSGTFFILLMVIKLLELCVGKVAGKAQM